MAYYNPKHYGWSITTPYCEEEEEEEESPPRKQKSKKKIVTSEETIPEQEKSTRKKPAIKSIIEIIKKRAEGQTSVTEEIEYNSNQFEDKGDD